MENPDIIVLFEAPKIIPPEFRLYYDERGDVLLRFLTEQFKKAF